MKYKIIIISFVLCILPLITSAAANNYPNGFVMYGRGGNGTAATSSLVVSPTGKVGIGTTSPSQLLSISGINGAALSIHDQVEDTYFEFTNAGAAGQLKYTTPGVASTFFAETDGLTYLTAQAPGATGILGWNTNNTERMRITAAGNVGVGTSSPYAKLSVGGLTAADYFVSASTTQRSEFNGGLYITAAEDDVNYIYLSRWYSPTVNDTSFGQLFEGFYSDTIRFDNILTTAASSIFNVFQINDSGRFFPQYDDKYAWSYGSSLSPVGTKNIEGMYGFYSDMDVSTAGLSPYSGTLKNLNAFMGEVALGSGNITNFRIFYGTTTSALATVTNAYGLELPDINFGSSQNFAIKTGLGNVSFGDKVGVGTTTPRDLFHVESQTATTSVVVSTKAASKGGRFILEDIDGAGCTEITALNGVLSAKIVTCPTGI